MIPPARWRILPGDENAERSLADELGVSPAMARLLVNRGAATPQSARAFLGAPLAALRDPMTLACAPQAAARLAAAVEKGERVVVFGDYDVDGMTATALMVRFLRGVGQSPEYYIPSRAEGHGLSVPAMERIIENGARLIVTVDTGVDGAEAVKFAKARGVDVIITDHHRLKGGPPPALATVNPTRADCGFGFSALSGAGVAFQLAAATRRVLRERGRPAETLPNLKRLLDLVALGSVADMMPLVEDNRILIRQGLEVIGSAPKAGIAALWRLASREGAVTAKDLAFELAPRLNAAGRLGDPRDGVELLITDDDTRARTLAGALDELNRTRKRVQEETLQSALAIIESDGKGLEGAVVAASPDWNAGIIGVVAAKLLERYRAPVALVAFEDGMGKGSARSLPGLDITSALTQCADHLERFGGHAGAAGFVVRQERYPAFREALLRAIRQARDNGAAAAPHELLIDLELDPARVDHDFVNALAALEPCGVGAPEPVFMARAMTLREPPRLMGARQEHVRLTFANPSAPPAVGFYMASKFTSGANSAYDIVYTPQFNLWRDKVNVQLRLLDIRSTIA